jgi:hypothetical protein
MSDAGDSALGEGGTRGIDPENALHLAYAEASIMLMECLMLTLVERKVLSPADVSSALETAIQTKESFAREGTHRQVSLVAAGVLRRFHNSLAAAQVR